MFLAPSQVQFQFMSYLDIPIEGAALLYPSSEARTIEEMPADELKKFKTFILIESTWEKSLEILKQYPQLQTLPQLKLTQPKTMYWRNNGRGSSCLSTIETIYHLMGKQFSKKTHIHMTFYYSFLRWSSRGFNNFTKMKNSSLPSILKPEYDNRTRICNEKIFRVGLKSWRLIVPDDYLIGYHQFPTGCFQTIYSKYGNSVFFQLKLFLFD